MRVTDQQGLVCKNHLQFGRWLDFAEAMAMERQLLDDATTAARHGERSTFISLWQTEKSIVLPSGMLRRGGLNGVVAALEGKGWPVYERDTGGDLTPQFDGVLNISMAFPMFGRERNIAQAYARLTSPLIAFLKHHFGLMANTASVAGAFCDGAHNLVFEGKKLAGTAQRWRPVSSRATACGATAVLAHAALLCNGDLSEALATGNSFFAISGIDRRIDPSVHVTMSELVGDEQGTPREFARSFAEWVQTNALHEQV